ncbi:MAG TPA: oligopeptide transporter, OPT family [Xanthobacteraceae bacterium]|jgi:putative OPT family oligopeptide transporter|nr:oligopeptide transporter, OPT family [Xanthobacteraceae bacterium]
MQDSAASPSAGLTISASIREFSIRGIVLGVLITTVFTAANVYLGLKVGLTFATSIPAAVISMAVLSAFKGATILENNIVQTVASAAGTLSAIIFVLPGLVIVGWWTGFPFWTSFLICASGGILGVLFTIPLRRAMVTTSDLPYPEGVAAAEVLEVGSHAREAVGEGAAADAREGLFAVVYGAVAAAGLAALAATRIAAGEVTQFFRFGNGAISGYDMSFSLALLGAGYLVGLSVGMAMLLGLLIAWAGAVPFLTAMAPLAQGAIGDRAMDIWTHQVRFIGAGTIGVAAIWTLLKLAGPVARGLASTITASRAAKAATSDRRDLDMSAGWIGALTVACLVVIALILARFLAPTPLAGHTVALVVAAVPFVFFAGFLVAAICGYMAGLIGASNSPISGVGILAILTCAALLVAVAGADPASRNALVAYALFTTAIVFAIATISNNNLQDLKTGQLVGATPSAQQWALVIGVIAGAAVIPPVLNLLAQAYGFVGAPHSAAAIAKPLPAPQAGLISALAQGVITHKLNWLILGIGAALGAVVVAIDEFLAARKWLRLPPLAVGIGIYLPMSATLPVVIGAVIGHWYDGRAVRSPNPEHAKRLGVLVASGMIVGESLFGVLLAGLIVALSTDAPLGLVPADFAPANWIGLAAFALLIAVLYGWMLRRSRA